jgi:hypothetical protein
MTRASSRRKHGLRMLPEHYYFLDVKFLFENFPTLATYLEGVTRVERGFYVFDF